jgi:tRNA G18 (ribose-2'-O)-methylase SpoU
MFPMALLLGNEVKGLSSKILEKVDGVVEIPMLGQKESLNVSVSFGIAAHSIVTSNQ